MHLDSKGLILTGTDGGDSCQRMFEVYLRQAILNQLCVAQPILPAQLASLTQAQSLLEISSGIYVRNPDPAQWYSDPTTTSRDQLTTPMCYHSYKSFHGDAVSKSAIRRLLWACLKRAMFAQNIHNNYGASGTKLPDILDPGLWGVFIRSSKIASILLYPFLMFCDVSSLLGVIISLWLPKTVDGTLQFFTRGPDDVDDDNMNNVMMTAQYTIATPFSWLARKVYKTFRQQNYGNTVLGETSAILGAMAWYNRVPDGNPEIVELARPIVERY